MSYEVEAILDVRKVKKSLQYKVKWLGYDENESTWEPVQNLSGCQSLIDAFEKKRKEESEKPKEEEPEKPKEEVQETEEKVEEVEDKSDESEEPKPIEQAEIKKEKKTKGKAKPEAAKPKARKSRGRSKSKSKKDSEDEPIILSAFRNEDNEIMFTIQLSPTEKRDLPEAKVRAHFATQLIDFLESKYL